MKGTEQQTNNRSNTDRTPNERAPYPFGNAAKGRGKIPIEQRGNREGVRSSAGGCNAKKIPIEPRGNRESTPYPRGENDIEQRTNKGAELSGNGDLSRPQTPTIRQLWELENPRNTIEHNVRTC